MRTQQIFLNILNKSIHPDVDSIVGEPIESEDWEKIINLSVDHLVLPMVYGEVWNMESFHKLSEDMRMKLKCDTKHKVMGQILRTEIFLNLYQQISNHGITPLVFKGLICREMYPKSDERTSGDEDFIVKKEEFARLDQILLASGFQRDNIENMEDAHVITYLHEKSGLHLEVHLTLFSKKIGKFGHLNKEFPHIFERQVIQSIRGIEVHTLDWTQHMLYLLCHGLKHFLSCGFGIRQLIDMIIFAETYGDQIVWEEVIFRTKRQNIYVFWMNLFDIGERYLGFSWEKARLSKPDEKILHSDALLQDILDGGIYGHRTQSRIHSANITLSAVKQVGRGWRTSLFPDVEFMCINYPYLKQRKWLLPIAWMSRIVSFVSRTRKKGLMEMICIGRNRMALLKTYEIIEK